MMKEIELVFHNEGLRSYIEVDLCRECPDRIIRAAVAIIRRFFILAISLICWETILR